MRSRTALSLTLVLTACAGQLDSKVVIAENVIRRGDESWDEHTDAMIAKCRDQNLPTPEARDACIAPVREQDDKVGKALTAAVLALRAYWIARASGKSQSELRALALNVASAVADLPPEYFGELSDLLR